MREPESGRGAGPAGGSVGGATAADSARLQLLRGYYLATPLFLVADLTLGWNVRIAGLEGLPGLRVPYYLVCFGLGVLAWMRPERAELVGFVECSVNLVILVVGTYAAYWGIIDLVLADQPIVNPFTTERITNLILSGTVLSISYYGHPWVRGGSRRGHPPFG
jgi:hypothetical protein